MSVSFIFDTGATYSRSYNKWYFVNIEEKKFPRNLKCTKKGFEISGFSIVSYSARSESGCTIALRDQAYYVPGLPKYLHKISPQGINTSEG